MTVLLTDTFTDTDSTLLENHTGELGAVWNKNPAVAGSAQISSNALVPSASTEALYHADINYVGASLPHNIGTHIFTASSQFSTSYTAPEAANNIDNDATADRWISADNTYQTADGLPNGAASWWQADFVTSQTVGGIQMFVTLMSPKEIEVYVSDTGAFAGEETFCGTITNIPTPGELSVTQDTGMLFVPTPAAGRYMRLVITKAWADIPANLRKWVSVNEFYFYGPGQLSANYFVSSDIVRSGTDGSAGVTGRQLTDAETYYGAQYNVAPGQWELYRVVAGVPTLLGTYVQALTISQTYVLKLTIKGTGTSVDLTVSIDGVDRITYTDTDASRIVDYGEAGVWFNGGSGSGNGLSIDNISAESVSLDTVSINDLVEHWVFQRSAGSHDVTLAGSYIGTPTAIEARIMSGAAEVVTWTQIDASPSGGTFSGTITVPEGGFYTAEVRFANDTTVSDVGVNTWAVGDRVVVAGQSNAENWFTDGTSDTADPLLRLYEGASWNLPTVNDAGAVAFGNHYIATAGVPTVLVMAAQSGTGLLQEASVSYWLTNALAKGNVYHLFTDPLDAMGYDIAGIVWAQGERDALSGVVTEAEYQAGLEALIAFFRADTSSPALPIVISYLGRSTDVSATDAAFQGVRNAQKTVVAADTNIQHASVMDIALADTIHLADYKTHGERCAQSLLDLTGDALYSAGPSILYKTLVDSTTVDVFLSHDTGTDITPVTGITGFEVFDDGTPVAITAAVKQTASSIRLSLASAITGTMTARYQYGANPDVTAPVLDNTSMTLPVVWNSDIQDLVSLVETVAETLSNFEVTTSSIVTSELLLESLAISGFSFPGQAAFVIETLATADSVADSVYRIVLETVQDVVSIVDVITPVVTAILQEILMLSESHSLGIKKIVQDLVYATDSITARVVVTTREILRLTELVNGPAAQTLSVNDITVTRDSIKAVFLETMAEVAVLDTIVNTLFRAYHNVMESLPLADTVIVNQQITLLIDDLVTARDTISTSLLELLAELFLGTDSSVTINNALSDLKEVMAYNDNTDAQLTANMVALDHLVNGDDLDSHLSATNTLFDSIDFVLLEIAGDSFVGYVMNTHNYGVTTYSGYDFNSYAKIGGTVFAASRNGLYKLGGGDDNGTQIEWSMKTGKLELESGRQTRVEHVFIGATAENKVVLKAIDGAGNERWFLSRTPRDGANTLAFSTNRGVKSRYWQFEAVGSGSVDINQIELQPVVLRRR